MIDTEERLEADSHAHKHEGRGGGGVVTGGRRGGGERQRNPLLPPLTHINSPALVAEPMLKALGKVGSGEAA